MIALVQDLPPSERFGDRWRKSCQAALRGLGIEKHLQSSEFNVAFKNMVRGTDAIMVGSIRDEGGKAWWLDVVEHRFVSQLVWGRKSGDKAWSTLILPRALCREIAWRLVDLMPLVATEDTPMGGHRLSRWHLTRWVNGLVRAYPEHRKDIRDAILTLYDLRYMYVFFEGPGDLWEGEPSSERSEDWWKFIRRRLCRRIMH